MGVGVDFWAVVIRCVGWWDFGVGVFFVMLFISKKYI